MLGCGTTELGIFVVLPKVGMHQTERSLRNGPVDNLMEPSTVLEKSILIEFQTGFLVRLSNRLLRTAFCPCSSELLLNSGLSTCSHRIAQGSSQRFSRIPRPRV